jgi:hypothetical protein
LIRMLRTELFRPEAIEFQKNNRQWGHVAALQPRLIPLTQAPLYVVSEEERA